MISNLQPCAGNTLTMASSVMISVLGVFRLIVGGYAAPITSESKSEHLLICLALAQQHRLPRTQLLERVWPDPTRRYPVSPSIV